MGAFCNSDVETVLTPSSLSSIMASMNRLTNQQRAKALQLLCEGMSIRAVTRVTGFSKTTVSKLVVDAGQAAAWYQDRVFQSLACREPRPTDD
jgi:DNA-directed RNA polymerase specialized sigma24 family protein